MRALVTGISGFVGHHLAAELLGAGHAVRGLVISDAEPVPPGVDHVDVVNITDAAALDRTLAAGGFDAVFHLAGASSVGQSFADPLGTWRVNLDGTLHLLEGLRAHAPAARCVVVTSAEVYGHVPADRLPATAETPFDPRSPYAASKAAADLAALQYRTGYGMPVMRVRSFNHIGPGQDARFFVPGVARQIAIGEREGGPVTVRVGNLTPRRDLSDVRDIVRAYRLIAEHGDPDVAYLPCSGRSVAMGDVLGMLASASRAEVRVEPDPARMREGEHMDLYGSPDRLTADTGWVPRIPLEVSLQETLDWWRARVAEED